MKRNQIKHTVKDSLFSSLVKSGDSLNKDFQFLNTI